MRGPSKRPAADKDNNKQATDPRDLITIVNKPTHLEQTVQRDVDRIHGKMAEMCDLAVQALEDCIHAIVNNDRQRAYAVILRDRYIDEKEKEIDRLCLEFLVRQQPVAGLLRFAYSAIKINLDLERVGDYAESIARQFLKLTSMKVDIPKARLVEIADLSIPMLRDCIKAFVSQDAELAKQTIEVEDRVDGLKSRLNKDLVAMYKDNKIPFEALNPLMMITRRLERVSDQARNICMEVLYMCTGDYSKHPDTEVFRVLFVDNANSSSSQMAEAMANALNQPKFIFSSGGLEPRPIEAKTVEFMKSHGLDLSRMASKVLHQVPNLDHYQVIVALDQTVKKAFPQKPRKVVYLDWTIDDPAQAQGNPEQIQAAYEKTFQYLQSHIQDLVEAILGQKPDVTNTSNQP